MIFLWRNDLMIEKVRLPDLLALWEAGSLGQDRPEGWRPWVRLVAPLRGVSSVGGEFEIPTGFVYDQASVPRLMSWLVSPDGPHIKRAACLHDYRCPWDSRKPDPSIGEILTSGRAADELFDGMMADGASRWRASLCRWAVRNYGPQF